MNNLNTIFSKRINSCKVNDYLKDKVPYFITSNLFIVKNFAIITIYISNKFIFFRNYSMLKNDLKALINVNSISFKTIFDENYETNALYILNNLVRLGSSSKNIVRTAYYVFNKVPKQNLYGLIIKISGKVYGNRTIVKKFIHGNNKYTGYYLNTASFTEKGVIKTKRGTIGIFVKTLFKKDMVINYIKDEC